MKRTVICLSLFLLLAACNKDPHVAPARDAQISFYNASYTLLQQLNNSNTARAIILFDEPDKNFQPPAGEDGYIMPFFGNGPTWRRQFPNTSYNATTLQPWVMYMAARAGEHTLQLMDTGRHAVLQTRVQMDMKQPVTIYFADSLGVFGQLLTADEQVPGKDLARLRLVHLSPDAGPVYARVNGTPSAGLQAMSYLRAATYQDFPCTARDTLKVRIYQTGNSTNVLARASVEILPGHAYTLLLTGYLNGNRQYKAPDGVNIISVNPNLQLQTIKSY